ncbi:MAG: hypothetical protein AB7R00_32220 [Kofleriaceae bacterium]
MVDLLTLEIDTKRRADQRRQRDLPVVLRFRRVYECRQADLVLDPFRVNEGADKICAAVRAWET